MQQTVESTAPNGSWKDQAIQFLSELGRQVGAQRLTKTRIGPMWFVTMTLKTLGIVGALSVPALYVLLSPPVAMNDLYNKILFVPTKEMPDIPKTLWSCPVEEIYFNSKNGAKLHGLYLRNAKAQKTILMSHGNGGNLAYHLATVEACILAGANVFIYDYQGFGHSEGTSTLDTCVEDGLAAYDCITKEKNISAANIVLLGQSIGTGVACQIAANRPASSLILLSAYTDILRAGRERLPFLHLYPDAMFPRQILNSANVLAKPHPKTLIVHGGADQLLGVQLSKDLKANAIGETELIVVPTAGHNDILNIAPDQVIAAIKRMVD